MDDDLDMLMHFGNNNVMLQNNFMNERRCMVQEDPFIGES